MRSIDVNEGAVHIQLEQRPPIVLLRRTICSLGPSSYTRDNAAATAQTTEHGRERGIPISQAQKGSVSCPDHHRSTTAPVSSRTGSSTFSYPTYRSHFRGYPIRDS
jgi:hypothetical protein